MQIELCGGKYTIHLSDDLTRGYEDGKFSDKCEPFIQHIVNPKLQRQLSMYTWCWEQLVQNVGDKSDVESVVELFGGIGRSSVIIQNELAPNEHHIYDLSDVMVEHLLRLFGWVGTIRVGRQDSIQVLADGLKLDADFVAFDINHFTIRSLYKEQLISAALGQVFASWPSFVELTDTARSYLHLNKKLYSQLSGFTIANFDDYIYALSEVIRQRWHYGITFVAHCGNVTAILLEPIEHITLPQRKPQIIDARDHVDSAAYWKVK